jgi:lipopolysaccharide/colanic/teichoic acid biosynthesis glycosyltransferase
LRDIETQLAEEGYKVAILQVADFLNVADPLCEAISVEDRAVFNEDVFKRMIAIERKRTERSKEPFLLMLLEPGNSQHAGKAETTLEGVMSAMRSCTRETDVLGWYKTRAVAGVIFTGLTIDDKNVILSAIRNKVNAALHRELSAEQFDQIIFSFHFFPDDWDHDSPGSPSNPALYPDLSSDRRSMLLSLGIKRTMDIIGSSILLILCAPLFAVIAVAIKVFSEGPVLFKQKRVGQYGRCFTFLKFRSMQANNDARSHKEYVEKLIAGEGVHVSENTGECVYKMANDQRITKIGKFLRKTSLDELPQFVNVLMGDMSLVGPRPPIPYEVAAYQTWHRRRILEVKPGITGLWQVVGRSRVKFDDMVRLDLRYAMSWSPWLDVKILIRTPAAVLRGAY